MKIWISILMLTSALLASEANAQDLDFSCVVDADSISLNMHPEDRAVFMEAASGAYGLSCQDIKMLTQSIKTVTAVVVSVRVLALKYPKLALLVASAGVQLESNQYVLLVTIVGAASVYYAYLKLDEASKACDQQDQYQKYQQMIDERLDLHLVRPVPIRCEGSI